LVWGEECERERGRTLKLSKRGLVERPRGEGKRKKPREEKRKP
jgi:hypothetical protein